MHHERFRVGDLVGFQPDFQILDERRTSIGIVIEVKPEDDDGIVVLWQDTMEIECLYEEELLTLPEIEAIEDERDSGE